MLNVTLKRYSRSAFTLIELLVVIAIISILAAILFPVFARARENARRTTCISNVKQINLGMMQYTQDYDGYYPTYAYSAQYLPGVPTPDATYGGPWNGTTSTYWFWQNVIYPYVKTKQVFICPSSPAAGSNYNAAGVGPYNAHYGANTQILINGAYGAPGKHTNIVVAPAKTYLFMDSSFYTIDPSYADGPTTSANYFLPGICKLFPTGTTITTKDCWSGRHFDGVTVGFADGHVKWLSTATVSAEALKTAPTLDGAWNPANP